MTATFRLRSSTRVVQDYLTKVRRRIPITRAYVFG